MPIIKSAKKRVKVARKAATRNYKTKRDMRDAIKSFLKSVSGGKSAEIATAQAKAISAIDKAAKKHVIHKNKAARQKSKLAQVAKTAGAKPAVAKKASPKKPTAKKPTAKKPLPKKLPPKNRLNSY